jgi:hypothetical protein
MIDQEDEIRCLHIEMNRFCDDCDDPIVSPEGEEIWGCMQYWDLKVCEPGEACRRNKEYYKLQDRLDELLSEMAKEEVA